MEVCDQTTIYLIKKKGGAGSRLRMEERGNELIDNKEKDRERTRPSRKREMRQTCKELA